MDKEILTKERNALAQQRTFLSWIRTGLAVVGGGLAVIRLLTFTKVSHQMASKSIGAIFVCLGIVIFGFAYYDFRVHCKRLGAGQKKFYAEGVFSLILSLLLIFCSLVLLILTLIS